MRTTADKCRITARKGSGNVENTHFVPGASSR